MKKIKYIISLCWGVLLLGTTSCLDDGKEDFLDEYNTRLYFINSGEQDVTLYKTGEDAVYSVPLYKGGYDDKATANVNVAVMDQAQLAVYNTENVTNYTLLPSATYALEETSFSFAGDELSKVLKVVFKTDAISVLPEADYVLPLALTADKMVNEKKNIILIKPSIIVPSVYFAKTGFVDHSIYVDDKATETVTLTMTMPMDNLWDFGCDVDVDESLLEAYNAENKKNLKLLPTTAYTMEVAPFKSGDNTSPVTLSIDKSKLEVGKYALPLRLSGCDNENFVVDESRNACILGVNYTMPRSSLSEIKLSLGMISSNATHAGDGTGLAGLFDGCGSGLHWHSNYSGEVIDEVYAHYIDFALPREITAFAFDFWTRFENGNGAPTSIVLYTSNDGKEWTKMDTIELELSAGNEEYNSEVSVSKTPFKYLRFSVPTSNNGNVKAGAYWNCGDMKIYGN